MQNRCLDFALIKESIGNLSTYRSNILETGQNQITKKLMDIYEQLMSGEIIDQDHVSCKNLMCYLKVIKIYCPSEFNTYVERVLNIVSNPKNKNIYAAEDDLIELVAYIYHYSNYQFRNGLLLTSVSKILINKQSYIINKYPEESGYYLAKLKSMMKGLKNVMKLQNMHFDDYWQFMILNEVVNKNISLYLGTNSVINIYKQEIDHNKVNLLLGESDALGKLFTMKFERNLFNALDLYNRHRT